MRIMRMRSEHRAGLGRRRACRVTGIAAAVLSLWGAGGGCVEQTLTIETNPPGALVYLNDLEVGRTPVTRDYQDDGDYDVAIRLEGYETIKTHRWIVPPAWNAPPFDLFAQLSPFTYRVHKTLKFQMQPSTQEVKPEVLVDKGLVARSQLQSSAVTRAPIPRGTSTKPATVPTTGASTTTTRATPATTSTAPVTMPTTTP